MCSLCEPRSPALSRRRLLGGGAVLAAAAVGALPAFAKDAKGASNSVVPPPNAISPDDAMKRIVDGNARYVAGNLDNKDFSAGRGARAAAPCRVRPGGAFHDLGQRPVRLHAQGEA